MIRFDRHSDWAATQFAKATDPDHEPMSAPRVTGPSSSFGLTDEDRAERSAILTAAPRIVRNGLDYQGRYPSALGQISNAELQRYSTGQPIAGESCAEDDDRPPQTHGERMAMAIVAVVSVVCVVLAAVNVWARFA